MTRRELEGMHQQIDPEVFLIKSDGGKSPVAPKKEEDKEEKSIETFSESTLENKERKEVLGLFETLLQNSHERDP